jgi:sugar/nucleoside kinase (ribokinase family)
MADLAVIGHMAIDKIISSEGMRNQLGGPPTYVALVARRLGRKIDVVTKVGDDMTDDLLSKASDLGIDLQGSIIEGAATTRFTLDYRKAERGLRVDSVCDEIGLEDVAGVSEAVIIAPIIGEISPATIACMEPDVIAMDPQGFLREILDNGSIRLRPWYNKEILRRVDIYKSSVNELELVTGESTPWKGLERILRQGAEIAIATKGVEGSLLATGGKRYSIPAFNSITLDPTGAGDAFLGCFFIEYLDGKDPVWCVSMGSAIASFVVETTGAEINASMKEVTERAEDIFNRSVKL